ncbi:MAG: hypothetical protein PWP23_2635 [Candidatus Sumerlaeota bacterium]|nr:hypothetical protein [Candidatus Sumerlaeota bacterium]
MQEGAGQWPVARGYAPHGPGAATADSRTTIGEYSLMQINEWLQTDGRGGFACGTISGRVARRWHGFWVAQRPPRSRVQLLAGLEEYAVTPDGSRLSLVKTWNGTEWVPAALEGEYEADMDQWTYEIGGLDTQDRSVVLNRQGPPAMRLSYSPPFAGDGMAAFAIRPLFPFPVRVTRHNDRLLEFHGPDKQSIYVHAASPLEVSGETEELPGVVLEIEKDCEKEWTATLWRGPEVVARRQPGGAVEIVFSPSPDPGVLEDDRVQADDGWVFDPSGKSGALEKILEGGMGEEETELAFDDAGFDENYFDEFEAGTDPTLLATAARAFIVTAESGRQTIMAGYPWFTDWGRDTMIALPGLCLCTGNVKIAQSILDHFLDHLEEGLIPNLFPESGEEPRYNTIDATLWMVEAAFRIDDEMKGAFIDEQRWGKLQSVIDWHVRGTKNGIRVDEDGMLAGGSEGSQLTWMDIKIDGHVPTPRHGKPIEIQGLWFNALKRMEKKATELGAKEQVATYRALAGKCSASVAKRFFAQKSPWPADVVDRDGPGTADWSIRPNMVIPFGLTYNVLPADKRADVLRVAARNLLTPRGLRTLSTDHPAYQGIYSGDVQIRDRAYHQGTVWMWLLLPYVKGVLAEREKLKKLFGALPTLADGLLDHLWNEGCIMQANEIFDGDTPHTPRGCFAQAWSVAAIIEIVTILREEGLLL